MPGWRTPRGGRRSRAAAARCAHPDRACSPRSTRERSGSPRWSWVRAARARRTPSTPQPAFSSASAWATRCALEHPSPSCTRRAKGASTPARPGSRPPSSSATFLRRPSGWSSSAWRRRLPSMRILYGVVGEGMGPTIRARVVLDELVQRHEVQVVVSGRAHDYLAKRANAHLQVKKIWGFTIVTEDNEVRNFRTLFENLKGALTGGWPRNIKTYFEIADSFRPDVVISDFESWSYLYGVNHALPVIYVHNMQIINRCRHDRDVLAGHEASFQLAKGILKAKGPGAHHYLTTHF